jgi:hypothetical protein
VFGVGSGSRQSFNNLWIETNITNKGALSVMWWDGNTWTEYPMTNNVTFYYKEMTNLNNNWQTFNIKNSTNVILNFTKPSLNRNNTGSRTDEQKYVSFNNTKTPMNFQDAANEFAELIVRECIELNRQELSFSAFARMLDKYSEHFGVE